jgi:multimeric flavodoxin WrbA
MKKILAVIGSPRKGDTYQAVSNFETALNKIEEVEIEYVMLSKVGFPDCTGCHNCCIKGQEFCGESGKVKELHDKMLAADAVILASPVYNQYVTALMKKFLDYYTYLWHRPEMFGIKFFGISSGGGMFREVFKLFKMNVRSWGGIWAGELGVPHYESLMPKYKEKCDKDYSRKAEIFIRAIEDKKLPSPGINQLMMFNIWKMNAVACRESLPKDFEYWNDRGLLDKDYYFPVKIGVIKRVAVWLIVGITKSFMKKVYLGYEGM